MGMEISKNQIPEKESNSWNLWKKHPLTPKSRIKCKIGEADPTNEAAYRTKGTSTDESRVFHLTTWAISSGAL